MFKALWLLHSAMGNGGQKGSEAPRGVNATPPLPSEMATGNGEQKEGSGISGETPITKGSAETSPAPATNEIQPSLAANEGLQPSPNGMQPSLASNEGQRPSTNERQQPATNERQPSLSINQGQEPHNSNLTVNTIKGSTTSNLTL
jgi:hypothetical protein